MDVIIYANDRGGVIACTPIKPSQKILGRVPVYERDMADTESALKICIDSFNNTVVASNAALKNVQDLVMRAQSVLKAASEGKHVLDSKKVAHKAAQDVVVKAESILMGAEKDAKSGVLKRVKNKVLGRQKAQVAVAHAKTAVTDAKKAANASAVELKTATDLAQKQALELLDANAEVQNAAKENIRAVELVSAKLVEKEKALQEGVAARNRYDEAVAAAHFDIVEVGVKDVPEGVNFWIVGASNIPKQIDVDKLGAPSGIGTQVQEA